jgi:hypothetical protein
MRRDRFVLASSLLRPRSPHISAEQRWPPIPAGRDTSKTWLFHSSRLKLGLIEPFAVDFGHLTPRS